MENKEVNFIDIFEIKKNLKGAFIGKNLYYEDRVDSTNTLARDLASKGVKNGSVIIADCQNKGKGRNGKVWSSPCGQNIYMSIVLKPKFTPETAQGMTIIAAASVADAITEIVSPVKPQIKWPNDVLIGSRKVSGILTEMATHNMTIDYVVVGIGINVNMPESDMDESIKSIATSLAVESAKLGGPQVIDRNRLIAAILNKFDKYYEMFLSTGLSSVLGQYQKYFGMMGKTIEINGSNGKVEGQVVGIDSKGALLLKTGENELERIVSGEIYLHRE